jgi:hypothetical protein
MVDQAQHDRQGDGMTLPVIDPVPPELIPEVPSFLRRLQIYVCSAMETALVSLRQRPACQRCGHRPSWRPRGLCWVCYRRLGIRELYPSTSQHGRRGPGNFNGTGTVPIATDALPGTPAKVRILMERVANRHRLWHADDAARP